MSKYFDLNVIARCITMCVCVRVYVCACVCVCVCARACETKNVFNVPRVFLCENPSFNTCR